MKSVQDRGISDYLGCIWCLGYVELVTNLFVHYIPNLFNLWSLDHVSLRNQFLPFSFSFSFSFYLMNFSVLLIVNQFMSSCWIFWSSIIFSMCLQNLFILYLWCVLILVCWINFLVYSYASVVSELICVFIFQVRNFLERCKIWSKN